MQFFTQFSNFSIEKKSRINYAKILMPHMRKLLILREGNIEGEL
jgi:hypothetical protein